jgi:hypothetical protein
MHCAYLGSSWTTCVTETRIVMQPSGPIEYALSFRSKKYDFWSLVAYCLLNLSIAVEYLRKFFRIPVPCVALMNLEVYVNGTYNKFKFLRVSRHLSALCRPVSTFESRHRHCAALK